MENKILQFRFLVMNTAGVVASKLPASALSKKTAPLRRNVNIALYEVFASLARQQRAIETILLLSALTKSGLP